MNFNLHTHTSRCHHAVGSEREYIERAIAAGLHTLGFSDHAPMPFPNDHRSTFRMAVEEIDGYFDTLLALRREYADKIDLKIGFEAEYYPLVFPDFQKLIAQYPIDYLILGQHFLGNEYDSVYSGNITYEEKILQIYVDQLIEALRLGCYTYIAHPDLLRYEGNAAIYRKHMERLCLAAKETDTPLEINMLGIWSSRHYPSERFFRIAAEVGNIVVLGIDAHQPERILEQDVLQTSLAFAQKCGVRISDNIILRNPRLRNASQA